MAGVTLLELLCVFAIITILAGMLMGPVSRVLLRARAMEWAENAQTMLLATVQQLNRHFQGKTDFPTITLATLEAENLLAPSQLQFLKNRRVTFIPFSGSDPDEQVVIQVRIDPGFLTEAGFLTATKEEITKPPE